MYVVILAGGSGTRFWPLSRKKSPKQLMSIIGGRSMLQRTIERVIPLAPRRILIVTNQAQAGVTEEQIRLYRSAVPVEVIAEPVGRNTAPAIALAARIITSHDPTGVMVVLPADHFIRNEEGFRSVIAEACHHAANGWLVTIGITPTRPETGYGYIEADRSSRSLPPFPVRRFVEKPPLEKAMEYIQSDSFSWNSGMFVWRGSTILDALERHAPDIAAPFAPLDAGDGVWDLSDLEPRVAAIYGSVRSESIDYAVMEKAENVCVIPADIGWSDVGSWSALPEILPADHQGIVAIGTRGVVSIGAADSVVHAPGKVAALVGVRDLIVVDTPDALLVARIDQAQEVRKVVERLEQSGDGDLL